MSCAGDRARRAVTIVALATLGTGSTPIADEPDGHRSLRTLVRLPVATGLPLNVYVSPTVCVGIAGRGQCPSRLSIHAVSCDEIGGQRLKETDNHCISIAERMRNVNRRRIEPRILDEVGCSVVHVACSARLHQKSPVSLKGITHSSGRLPGGGRKHHKSDDQADHKTPLGETSRQEINAYSYEVEQPWRSAVPYWPHRKLSGCR